MSWGPVACASMSCESVVHNAPDLPESASWNLHRAANVVFRSQDEGMTWEVISDDQTHNMEDKMQVAGSPWMPEYFGQETFSTIHRLVESPHEQGVLWAGSDDGRIHLTRDGGEVRIHVESGRRFELEVRAQPVGDHQEDDDERGESSRPQRHRCQRL